MMAGGVDNKWIIRIFLASAAFDGILVGNINQMSWNWRDVVTKCSLRILGGKGVSPRGHSPFAALTLAPSQPFCGDLLCPPLRRLRRLLFLAVYSGQARGKGKCGSHSARRTLSKVFLLSAFPFVEYDKRDRPKGTQGAMIKYHARRGPSP